MADEATLSARLTEAETALHKLMMGSLIVEVEYEGHRTKFKSTDEQKLRSYIRDLKQQLGQPVAARSRAVRF
ncbi:gpW family head-tail joining protein [Thalassovita sp.]|uniref:gpW family head-tail joining protein n=1 Tax=Thalassovita sp. TaxID=1979401 RepID=UPI002AB31A63|nr:gpW family head-tail joining protein [Thalassovita sp.]